MLTGIITFVVIFAVVGSILYGRKLAKTEKLDAVFGNPERAKGGTHWIIVGSSFLLLTWLYYSWDMAKSFYPQSANELCQVAKVNDSMLSLKYFFFHFLSKFLKLATASFLLLVRLVPPKVHPSKLNLDH